MHVCLHTCTYVCEETERRRLVKCREYEQSLPALRFKGRYSSLASRLDFQPSSSARNEASLWGRVRKEQVKVQNCECGQINLVIETYFHGWVFAVAAWGELLKS